MKILQRFRKKFAIKFKFASRLKNYALMHSLQKHNEMGLSEPRKKVRYSVDPNALHWVKSEDKFGKKLMEKMGWKDGKGLGVNENGMTEHIKVKFKMDNKGVGFNKNDYDNVWLDHQDDYEQILSNLNQSKKDHTGVENISKLEEEASSNEKSVQSLETKSKQSRARLHYKKFTRSKDLSNATNEDLNCILGHKKRTQLKKDENENGASTNEDENSQDAICRVSFSLNETETKAIGQDSDANKNESVQQFSTNKMSMHDYFKIKLEERKNSLKTTVIHGQTEDKLEPIEADSELKPIEKYQEQCESEELSSKKKKKKKKKDQRFEEELIEEKVTGTPLIVEEVIEEPSKKKKKSKKSKESQESDQIEQEQIVYEVEAVKEKKKKIKSKEQTDLEVVEDNQLEKVVTVDAEITTQIIDEEEELDEKRIQRIDKKELEESMKSAFKGSNVFSIHGYSSYIVNQSIEDALVEKSKKAHKKRIVVEKNLQIDANFYQNNKKKTC